MDTHDDEGRPLFELAVDRADAWLPWKVYLGGVLIEHFKYKEDAQKWIDEQPIQPVDPEWKGGE